MKTIFETDLNEDLKKIDVPTLIIHGDDDQNVPIGASLPTSAWDISAPLRVRFAVRRSSPLPA